MRLDDCLTRAGFPELHALSIDTEGTELDVLKGLDLAKWRPKAMVVECWDAVNPIVDYLKAFGYERVQRRVVNDFYLREGA